MQIDHYLTEYKAFHETCGHVVNADTCLLKMYEECLEFIAAVESGDHDAIVSERLDVLNTAIFSTYMDGQADVLHFGRIKLEETMEKYHREGKIPHGTVKTDNQLA